MKIDINLAGHSDQTLKTVRTYLYWSILLLILIGLFNGSRYLNDMKRVKNLEASLAQRSAAAPSFQGEDLVHLNEQVALANSVLRQHSFPMLQLLDEIERVVPDGIVFKRVQISTKRSEIQMSGQAEKLPEFNRLMESLQTRKNFMNVFLIRQDETPAGGVAFDIKFQYRPAGESS